MKKSINVIVSGVLLTAIFWLSFYGGHLLKIGDVNQDAAWYVLPYIITCIVIIALFVIWLVASIDDLVSDEEKKE
jgi:hypothetical protein